MGRSIWDRLFGIPGFNRLQQEEEDKARQEEFRKATDWLGLYSPSKGFAPTQNPFLGDLALSDKTAAEMGAERATKRQGDLRKAGKASLLTSLSQQAPNLARILTAQTSGEFQGALEAVGATQERLLSLREIRDERERERAAQAFRDKTSQDFQYKLALATHGWDVETERMRQQFSSGEAEKTRAFEGLENALNRQNQASIAAGAQEGENARNAARIKADVGIAAANRRQAFNLHIEDALAETGRAAAYGAQALGGEFGPDLLDKGMAETRATGRLSSSLIRLAGLGDAVRVATQSGKDDFERNKDLFALSIPTYNAMKNAADLVTDPRTGDQIGYDQFVATTPLFANAQKALMAEFAKPPEGGPPPGPGQEGDRALIWRTMDPAQKEALAQQIAQMTPPEVMRDVEEELAKGTSPEAVREIYAPAVAKNTGLVAETMKAAIEKAIEQHELKKTLDLRRQTSRQEKSARDFQFRLEQERLPPILRYQEWPGASF